MAALLVVVAFLALAARWMFLADESLWLDEGWSWWAATLPPGRRLDVIRADVVAPAYFYALGGWARLFGDGVFAMRSLSAVFATLTLLPLAMLARRVLTSRQSMLVAAALVACSFMQAQYAREARPYALLCLAIIGALACVPTLAERQSWPAMFGFAICVVAGCYTHNVMPFYAVALAAAWMVWPGERSIRSRLTDLSIVVIACAMLYAPWLPSLRAQAQWMTGQFWASRPDAFAVGRAVAAVTGVDVYAVPPLIWAISGITISAGAVAAVVGVSLLSGMSASLMSSRRKNMSAALMPQRRILAALMIVAFAPMALVFIISRLGQPIFIERVFIATSAIIPLIVAACFDAARGWVRRGTVSIIAALLLLLGGLSTASLFTTPQKEDWRGAYEYVALLPTNPRRLVVFVATEGELPFAYYASHDRARRAEPRTGAPGGFFEIDPPRTIRRVQSDADLEGLRATLKRGVDEVLLVLSHDDFSDPAGLAEGWLRAHWRMTDERELRRVRILRFVRP